MRTEEFSIKKTDKWLLVLYFFMVIIGILNIYSTKFNPDHPEIWNQDEEYGKQITWFGLSLLAGGFILLLEGNFIKKFAYQFYGVVCLLLVAVLLVGVEKNGAKAWFGIGNFGIQPSEFAKVGVSLALAKFLSTPNIKLTDKNSRISTFLFIAVPAALIQLQPDTGTNIVFMAFILVLYREGMSGNFLLFGLLALILGVLTLMTKDGSMDILFTGITVDGNTGMTIIITLLSVLSFFLIRQFVMKRNRRAAYTFLVIAWLASIGLIFSVNYAYHHVLGKHQRERIDISLGLVEDPDGKGYNQDRAKAAIGSGGFWGKGFMNSTLSNAGLKHVPMHSTDFIYCTLSEEWGFAGSVTVIILFVILLFRIIIIAERQRSQFTRIFAYSVACIIFFHFLINIGMEIGLGPVIGIPLPFFSYGGSSLIAFSILIFILIKLDAERLDILR
ncbi:MAG: rod shape-determining protein RodA [Bacteroidota bacterium]